MISPTYIGAIVAAVVNIAAIFGIVLSEGNITTGLQLILGVVNSVIALVIFIRRLKQGDISIFGVRKK